MQGLGLLTLSTVEKILLYISLPLIAVGVSAYIASTLTPIGERSKPLSSSSESEPLLVTAASESDNASTGTANAHWTAALFENVLLAVLAVFLPVSALIAVGYVSPWWIKFLIPTAVTVGATIIFLTDSSSSYQREQGGLHLFTTIFTKIEIKTILFAVPMCITFILLGVVSSIGNTFFIEQAVDMNHYVGSLWVPILILPGIQGSVRKNWGVAGECCAKVPKFGIAMSMVFATLCCITAAKVETRRLGVVETEGFSDDATSIIPMTMFWLLPQYILLGLSEAFSEKCIAGFFSEELLPGANEGDEAAKAAKKKYIESFAQAVNGVGIILGVLIVYIVGEIQPTWFQSTVNKSRLDNYFWTLAALFAATLVLFGLFSCCLSVYEFKRRSTEDVEGNVTPATTTTT